MTINLIPNMSLRRKFKDSGTLVLRNTATITAGGIFVFELDRRFEPYDDVTAINLNNSNDCTLFINGNSIQQPLPRGNSVPLNHEHIRQIKVKNNGSTTISANQIEIYYRSTGKKGRDIVKNASNILGALSSLKILRGA